MFNGWLKYDFVNIGIVLLVSFAWFFYTLIFHDKKKQLGSIAYVLMVWFMCWWCSQRNILGVLLYCCVIPPRPVSLTLELDRQPRKPSISYLFTPHSAGWTDTFSHSQFLLIGNETWVLTASGLTQSASSSGINYFQIDFISCVYVSDVFSRSLSTCSFNFEVFSKSF